MTQVQIFSKPEPETVTVKTIPFGTYFWGKFPSKSSGKVKLYMMPYQVGENFYYVLDVEEKEIVGVYASSYVQNYTPIKRVEIHTTT